MDEKLQGYEDSDWVGSLDDSKSSSGCLSFDSGMFSWKSKKQGDVAQSTAYTGYISAANNAIWLYKPWKIWEQTEATVIWIENKSAISMAKNSV